MRSFPIVRVLVMSIAASLVLAALIVYGIARGQARQAARLDDFGAAPPFKLTDQMERPVSSADFRGKVVVANFIYTHCRDICPLLSLRMQALQERLRQEQLLGPQVQLLSFTVDPTRDTPAVLHAYAERHRADPSAWRFLTGPEAAVKPLIVDGFHLGIQALPPSETATITHGSPGQDASGPEVMHSGRFVLIDRKGHVRAYYDGRELDPDHVVANIRQVLH